ncbi:extracellular solute-binding protein [Caballeronia udeis]|uniref:Extracellular solute-binding protein n=1 Tax=Caballeronia udeis TaxID=1232866 RepID=A0A158JHH8_9BURK|nr:transporter substrate-binding domain-containing protein [Caballeronia udeis]SAL68274.1 extracellular solute-binding protein [Caballeronia udeis]
MKTLSKKLIVAAAIMFSYGMASSALADPVRVSVAGEPAPPLAWKNASGVWEGFEVDLAKAVCKASDIDCVIVSTVWDGIIPALQSKKIDVIWASMSITPEREKKIAFTIPYYNSPAEFIGNKDDKFDFTKNGLKGTTVGVEANTTFAQFMQKAYPSATVRLYNSQDAATADLSAGRVDLVISDAVALDDFIKGGGNACCERKFLPKDPLLDSGMAGGIRKDDSALKAKFDAGIRAIYASGEFNKIEKKYFKFDVGVPPKN